MENQLYWKYSALVQSMYIYALREHYRGEDFLAYYVERFTILR